MAGNKKDLKPAGGPSEKKGSMLGLGVLAVSAIAASFGVSYFLMPGTPTASATCETIDYGAQELASVEKNDQTYVQLPEVLITIGREPATRYLKMSITVATDKDGVKLVNDAEPVLMDAFIKYLRAVELEDFEDPAFYNKMREQLSRRSELVLGNSVSDGILITEFLLR